MTVLKTAEKSKKTTKNSKQKFAKFQVREEMALQMKEEEEWMNFLATQEGQAQYEMEMMELEE
jgi:hypothetical protein